VDEAASRVRLHQSLPPKDVRDDRVKLNKIITEIEHLEKRSMETEKLDRLVAEK
jgi:hypothetical protein